ncbi:MAG: trypsin-like peptidase domain-containing protein [Acidobacteria bacterium]|nr:trypsin-like peptidase domain-containing protein [Acidobacteriota bacterium]
MGSWTVLVRTALLVGLALRPGFSQLNPDEKNTIDVFKRAAPGVVHVKASRIASTEAGEVKTGEGSGSGFLIDDAGHLLTNYHVIENSTEIRLLLGEGRTLNARLVGTAPALDLALLKAEPPAGAASSGLIPLPLGDSDAVEVGQKVLAIGNPLGFHNTLTVGVVSGLARDIPGAPAGLDQAFLQTDAAINPGNSGGPLLDSAGRVIGINAVVAREGQNIGFAIPINFVKKILPDLIRMGHVYRPTLGFSALPITPGLSALLGLPVRAGLLVQEVAEGSPAARAGLQAGSRMVPMNETVYVLGGDIILAVNGKGLSSPHELTIALLGSKPGDRIRLTILRGEERQEKTLTLPPMHLE